MSRGKLRLVYSASENFGTKEFREDRACTKPTQLSLFAEGERRNIFFIVVERIDHFKFTRMLKQTQPVVVLDSREFPDFFSLSSSKEKAFREFGDRGVEYWHVPFSWSDINILNNKDPFFQEFAAELMRATEHSNNGGRFVNYVLLLQTEQSKQVAEKMFREFEDMVSHWVIGSLDCK